MSIVRSVIGGVDTHADFHVAAAIDANGGLLDVESFPADSAGYEALLGWQVGLGAVTMLWWWRRIDPTATLDARWASQRAWPHHSTVRGRMGRGSPSNRLPVQSNQLLTRSAAA